jgi:GH35 family endo-1,4-beta-xylanase
MTTRRVRNRMLAATAAAACITAAAVPVAHGAKGMEVAVQDDGPLVSNIGIKRSKDLKLLNQLRVTRIRVNLPWASIVNGDKKKKPPKHRHYNFTSYDKLYLAARKYGMRLQLTISGFAPRWATGDHKVGMYKPSVKYFKEFVNHVVKHFRHKVDRYAILNEPNYGAWLGPLSTAPKQYHNLYITAYKAIRSIDGRAKILIGETAPYAQKGRSTAPIAFLRKLLSYGSLKADGYSHHPYDFRNSLYHNYPGGDNVTMYTLSRLTKALDKFATAKYKLTDEHGKPLDLYLTEYGFMASGRYKKSDSTRAKYLTKAFQWALDNPRVKQMLQYLIVPPPARSMEFDTSIASKKGKPSKVFKALAKWAQSKAKAKLIARPIPPKNPAAAR